MPLNKLHDEVLVYAKGKVFKKGKILGEDLMLVVSELSEALEADRKGKWAAKLPNNEPRTFSEGMMHITEISPNIIPASRYEEYIKGTVEEEIADAFLRLLGLAGFYNINLDWHIRAKMEYNKTRPYKCGKKYG